MKNKRKSFFFLKIILKFVNKLHYVLKCSSLEFRLFDINFRVVLGSEVLVLDCLAVWGYEVFVRLRIAALIYGDVGRARQRSNDLNRRERNAQYANEHDRVERVILLELFHHGKLEQFGFGFTSHFVVASTLLKELQSIVY